MPIVIIFFLLLPWILKTFITGAKRMPKTDWSKLKAKEPQPVVQYIQETATDPADCERYVVLTAQVADLRKQLEHVEKLIAAETSDKQLLKLYSIQSRIYSQIDGAYNKLDKILKD